MATTAGALSKLVIGSTTAAVSSAVATGGTAPYTYQWYRSTTSGFTPGAGNIIAGAIGLELSDSGLLPSTQYYYEVIATDSGSVAGDSSQLSVLTEPSQSPNQFAQNMVVGIVDMRVGSSNVWAAQVDNSVASAAAPYNLILPGQAVKLVANTAGGIPKVAPVSGITDKVWGYVVFNIKDTQYTAGHNLEVARWGTVIWCYATSSVTQGNEVCVDPVYVGGVQPTGSTAVFVGQAIDGCSAAGQIRVELFPNIAYATA